MAEGSVVESHVRALRIKLQNEYLEWPGSPGGRQYRARIGDLLAQRETRNMPRTGDWLSVDQAQALGWSSAQKSPIADDPVESCPV